MLKQRKGLSARGSKIVWPQFMVKRFCEGGFILILTVALFVLLSLSTYQVTDPGWIRGHAHNFVVMNAGGQVGAYIADAFYLLFGYFSYTIPIYGSYLATMLLMNDHQLQSQD